MNKNAKPVELVLRRKSGAELFDVIVIGDCEVIDKYRKQIEEIVVKELLQ